MAALGSAAAQLDAAPVVALVLALLLTPALRAARLPTGRPRAATGGSGPIPHGPRAPAPTLLALPAARRGPAPLRHRHRGGLRRQPHPVERRESRRRYLRGPGEPLLPARGRAL